MSELRERRITYPIHFHAMRVSGHARVHGVDQVTQFPIVDYITALPDTLDRKTTWSTEVTLKTRLTIQTHFVRIPFRK